MQLLQTPKDQICIGWLVLELERIGGHPSVLSSYLVSVLSRVEMFLPGPSLFPRPGYHNEKQMI